MTGATMFTVRSCPGPMKLGKTTTSFADVSLEQLWPVLSSQTMSKKFVSKVVMSFHLSSIHFLITPHLPFNRNKRTHKWRQILNLYLPTLRYFDNWCHSTWGLKPIFPKKKNSKNAVLAKLLNCGFWFNSEHCSISHFPPSVRSSVRHGHDISTFLYNLMV